MTNGESVQSLVALGFTQLEAEVYVFLLGEAPATGYRVAQAIGRLPANTYKALESLQNKGAVIIDEGASRLCRAVPPAELLDFLKRRFVEQEARATRALSDIGRVSHDDRIYQLRSYEQVFARFRAMLARCRQVALIDIFPVPLEELRSDIEATAARGVQVTLKAFLPTEVPGVEVVLNPRGEKVMERYPGQWLLLLVDGTELLIAGLNPERKEVLQAVCSGSVPLSWLLHSSFATQLMLFTLCHHINGGATLEELQAAIAPFTREDAEKTPEHPAKVVAAMNRHMRVFASTIPGFEALVRRAGGASDQATAEKEEG